MEDEDSFTMYKTFELVFENEQGTQEHSLFTVQATTLVRVTNSSWL